MIFKDYKNREIRLTEERKIHLEDVHPEMKGQIDRVQETLKIPDFVFKSVSDQEVELFYKCYKNTLVTEKYLCVVIKVLTDDLFIITAYFTDSIKKGELIWEKK
ncbi:MAG: hypothetical protein HWN67_21345 [Candidatus Helarchaeota archaeon]|nr:hypothetical protein [Candidatus Helarchaeota archaeon]